MLQKLLDEIIVAVAGKPAEKIAELLNSNKHVNEFNIAKKMDLTINQTRNILYRISDYGLVSFIRKKDKKKGWYTYFWKIEILKALEFLKKLLLQRIEQIENQIKSRSTKQFYICERCSIELTEANALTHNFTCDECGDVFATKDNSKVLRALKRNLDRFQNELKLVNEEIEKENQKIDKKKERELRKQEREKEKKKASKKKDKKKVINKVSKKVAKKKSSIKKSKAVSKKTKKKSKSVKKGSEKKTKSKKSKK
jgi:transcription initiation factor TFIIE subunit alpha